jgi:hypothetical protein
MMAFSFRCLSSCTMTRSEMIGSHLQFRLVGKLESASELSGASLLEKADLLTGGCIDKGPWGASAIINPEYLDGRVILISPLVWYCPGFDMIFVI